MVQLVRHMARGICQCASARPARLTGLTGRSCRWFKVAPMMFRGGRAPHERVAGGTHGKTPRAAGEEHGPLGIAAGLFAISWLHHPPIPPTRTECGGRHGTRRSFFRVLRWYGEQRCWLGGCSLLSALLHGLPRAPYNRTASCSTCRVVSVEAVSHNRIDGIDGVIRNVSQDSFICSK